MLRTRLSSHNILTQTIDAAGGGDEQACSRMDVPPAELTSSLVTWQVGKDALSPESDDNNIL
jgi:hypothetical protein